MKKGKKASRWFWTDSRLMTFASRRYAETPRTAFAKTIEKWELIVKGYRPTGAFGDGNTCGLCNCYTCTSCPVFKLTGKNQCKDTPYSLWIQLSHYDNSDLRQEAALAELNFLKVLKKAWLKGAIS